uniref:Uncharacterized protein n=1 Tax=Moniliophthora roreri TaxID=221103 RepID=A0A0W0FSQ7_MONRR
MSKDMREIGLEISILDPASFASENSPHILKVNDFYELHKVASNSTKLISKYTNRFTPTVTINKTRNISPFALILNAYSKLKKYDLDSYPSVRNDLLKDQRSRLELLMKHIFWMPRNHPWCKNPPLSTHSST